MTADEFIAWAMEQPETEHYELVDGVVHAMAPQRSGHSLVSTRISTRLSNAIEAAGLPCFVYGDGMAVEIDATSVFEPDAMVRCGRDCREFRVLAGIMGWKENPHGPTQRAADPGRGVG